MIILFIEMIILGVVIAFLTKGRLGNLTRIELRGWLLVAAGVISIALFAFFGSVSYIKYFGALGIWFMLIAIAMNLRLRGMFIILIGGVLNLLAYIGGGLKMPIDLSLFEGGQLPGLYDSIVAGETINYISSLEVGKYSAVLGKTFITPDFYPYSFVFSAGDILMAIGLATFIILESHRAYRARSGSMVTFTNFKRI